MAVKARLLPRRSVAVTPVVVPAVPAVPAAVEVQVVVVVLVPVVVARQAEAEPALVVAAVALVPVVVALQVVAELPAVPVAERVVARFPSEQWSKGVPVAAAWAALRSSLPWPRLRWKWLCRRLRWLRLLSRSRCRRLRWPHPRSRFTRRRSRWPGPQPRFRCPISTSRYPISAFRASMCPPVPVFPAELSVAPPVPRSAVLRQQWSLMQEPRPPRPVVPLSKLRHRRWPEAVLAAAVPRVVPERQAAVPPVAALVQVVPERAAQVPEEMWVLSAAVPRQPVLRVAEPPSAAVPQAVLRPVPVGVLPLVAVPRLVVARPLAAVAPSRAARLPVLRWWTQPVCRRELRWWTLRWSDR